MKWKVGDIVLWEYKKANTISIDRINRIINKSLYEVQTLYIIKTSYKILPLCTTLTKTYDDNSRELTLEEKLEYL